MSSLAHSAWVEIDLDALQRNTASLRALAGGAALAAVVKANAYGHGAVAVAEAVIAGGAQRVCVFNLDEAEDLRRAGFSAPILVLGYVAPAEAERAVALDLALIVSHADVVHALARAAAAQSVTRSLHCKVEAGMYRFGLAPAAVRELAALVRAQSSLVLEGICTQYPAADSAEAADSEARFGRFLRVAKEVRAPIRHVANTAALIRFPHMALEMVRPGLGLFGALPSGLAAAAPIVLEPVLSWKARLIRMHDVPAGESISYGGTWTAPRDSRVGVLPVGYADGFRRDLAPGGQMLVHGRRAPVIGTVCMDMCMVDLSDVPAATEGTVAVLIGEQDGSRIAVSELAAVCGTVPYEILTGIGPRPPRVYLRDGRPIAIQTLLDSAPVLTMAATVEAVLLRQ